MSEPVMHEGVWWQQRPDGTWLRWDAETTQWIETSYVASPTATASVETPADVQSQEERVEEFESLRNPGRWVTSLLGATMVVDAVVLAVLISARPGLLELESGRSVDAIHAGISVGTGNLVGIDRSTLLASAAQLTMFVALLAPFLIWFQRAYNNLPSLGARGLRFSPGWAVGAWFVPVLNYFRPAQIAADIWRASDPSLPGPPPTAWRDRPMTPLILAWFVPWAFWLTFGQSPLKAGFFVDLGTGLTANTFAIAGQVARLIAGAAALVFVVLVTRRQEQRATTQRTEGQPYELAP